MIKDNTTLKNQAMAKTIAEKITDHYEHKTCAKIIRQIREDDTVTNEGCIVSYSADFIILQNVRDFIVDGYLILPISQLKQVRFNKNDRFYNKLMKLEKEVDKIGFEYNIDLGDWRSIFTSIKKYKLTVIIECENYEVNTFNLGPIARITNKKVYINYVKPDGVMEKKPTPVDFNAITKVGFDDKYSRLFGKYARAEK